MYSETPRRPTQLHGLPDGPKGIHATLMIMRRLVKASRTDIRVREKALSLVAPLPQKGWMREINTIFEFVRDGIRYTMDTVELEVVQTPAATLEIGQGDCDDKVTLCAALLESIGHPCRLVAVGEELDYYSHVYLETRVRRAGGGTHWIGMEVTENWPLGRVPARMISRMVVDI